MGEFANGEFLWPLRVYIEDTDAGGIVYYVNYLKYIERARTEMLRSIGFGKTVIFNDDLMFVVRSSDMQYYRAATLDDDLIATAQVLRIKGAKIEFSQRVLRGDEELCAGKVVIACVDKTSLKPRRVPSAIVSAVNESQLFSD